MRRSYSNRDTLMDARRDVRFRRTPKAEIPGVNILANASVHYRSVLPAFVISHIKAKLGARDIDIAVKVRSQRPRMVEMGELLEDWYRGARYELDPVGYVDSMVREHQAADGLGWAELDFRAKYVPPLRNGEDDRAYDEMIQEGREAYGLGVRLKPADPRSIYAWPLRGEPKVVVKVVNMPLIDVEGKYTADGFRIAYEKDAGEGGRFVKAPVTILGGELSSTTTIAAAMGASLNDAGMMVRIVVLADDRYIYHAMFPTPGRLGAVGLVQDDVAGSTPPQLEMLGVYPNPLGRPPFFKAIARPNDDPDPAYQDEPLAMELLDMAPFINTMRETRMIKGRIEALKPIHAKPRPGQTDSTTPTEPMVWKPGFVKWDGDFLDIPMPAHSDFDVFDKQLSTEFEMFNRSLMQALQSGAIGKSTPAWGLQMLTEEETGFLKDALDSRADMWRGILEGVAQCVRSKYGTDGKVYVLSQRRNKNEPATHREEMVGVTAEDLGHWHRLEVSVRRETQSQLAANTEYWRELFMEGTISRETYEEKIGISDRVAERARRDQEAVSEPMRQMARHLAWNIARERLRYSYGPIADVVMGAVQPPLPPSDLPLLPPGGGEAVEPSAEGRIGGGGAAANGPVTPGQGMSTSLPVPAYAQQARPSV